MSKNEDAWGKLFDKYDIVQKVKKEGRFLIKADEIKKFREPRLMTKFDHELDLPAIFLENELSILPVTRGSYIIAPFITYHKFEEKKTGNLKKIHVPDYLQSLKPDHIKNEAMALGCAYACKMLDDFLEDEKLFPTISGRMGSGEFCFNIKTLTGNSMIEVKNSQIEVDASYEGLRYLSLFEAKNKIYDDFLIRQLYYPFRSWEDKISKEIKSVFLVYTNGSFSFYQYKFLDPADYNSLYLAKQTDYQISTGINTDDIAKLLHETIIEEEPPIPFPQADSMARIINLLESLYKEDFKTKDAITEMYAFDERQTNYYTDAGRYLGLIDKTTEHNVVEFHLSNLGREIMSKPYREKQLAIAKQVIKHNTFNEILKIRLKSGQMPERFKVIQVMKESNLYNVNADSTYNRRASSVTGWVNWILSIIDE